MNILYGSVSFNPDTNSDLFPNIQNSLSEFAPCLKSDSIGHGCHIGVQTRSLHTEFQTQELLYTENNCQLISTGRIDNRKDLFALLSMKIDESIPNNILLLKLYLLLGDDFVKKIDGEWTLVIWNGNSKELFLARDPFGIGTIYYRKGHDYLAFSSLLKGLLDFDKSHLQINESYLAGILTVWDRLNDETAFEDIHFLLPAHYLKMSNGKTELKRYWIAENTPVLQLNTEMEYVARFNVILEQSVRNRIQGANKIGSQLSSGFDSSTITTVASEILKKEGKSLTAFTSIPKEDTSDLFTPLTATNESYLTIPTAQFLGNVDLKLIRSEQVSIVQNLKEMIDLHHSPLHAAGNLFWIYEIYRNAGKEGIDTMLIGQFGNSTISWTGYTEKNFVKEKIKQLIGFDSNEKLTISSYIRLMSQKFKKYIGIDQSKIWDSYSHINSKFAEDIDLENRMLESGHDPYFRQLVPNEKKQIQFINPQFSKIGAVWHDLSYYFDIKTFDPSADKNLVEFCLSVPNEYYYRYDTPKWLIKTAMKGRLLDDLIHQKKKGRQATDLSLRITNEAKEFEQLIESFDQNKAISYYLDIQKMKDSLTGIIKDPRNKNAYNNSIYLTRSISCALFIQSHPNKFV